MMLKKKMIGSTCDTLSKCMSNFRITSKSRVNWGYDKFYMIIRKNYINCQIELIENYACNNDRNIYIYVCLCICIFIYIHMANIYVCHMYIYEWDFCICKSLNSGAADGSGRWR
jgi:hypothetical protein